jgi:hypothetical protein
LPSPLLSRPLDGCVARCQAVDGTDVRGIFTGVEGDRIRLEGTDDVAVESVENVLVDIASTGEE